MLLLLKSRSREGAWIEIRNKDYKDLGLSVAPARERGLKCNTAQAYAYINRCRSREGAWIEIHVLSLAMILVTCCRSREGAWIEIHSSMMNINPVTRRSREGAWIEILPSLPQLRGESHVAPARERGLKLMCF